MPDTEMVTILYKGCEITHPKVPFMGAQYSVNVGSNNRNLAMRVREAVFNDNHSFEGGITLAKRYIDSIVA